MEFGFIIDGFEVTFRDIETLCDYLSDETGLYVSELKELKFESFLRLLRRSLELRNKELHRTEPDMESIRKLKSYKSCMVELKEYVFKIDKLDMLRNMRDIQGSKGNIDQGDYMLGLYNGLELALATLEDREAEFKNC